MLLIIGFLHFTVTLLAAPQIDVGHVIPDGRSAYAGLLPNFLDNYLLFSFLLQNSQWLDKKFLILGGIEIAEAFDPHI